MSTEAAPLPQSLTPSQPPDPPSFRQHAGSQLLRRSTHTSSWSSASDTTPPPDSVNMRLRSMSKHVWGSAHNATVRANVGGKHTQVLSYFSNYKTFNAELQLNLDLSCNFQTYMELNLLTTRNRCLNCYQMLKKTNMIDSWQELTAPRNSWDYVPDIRHGNVTLKMNLFCFVQYLNLSGKKANWVKY